MAAKARFRIPGPYGAAKRGISAGTAYAIWTGLGAVGGIIYFGEKVNPVQIGLMTLIVIGVAGTKFFAST